MQSREQLFAAYESTLVTVVDPASGEHLSEAEACRRRGETAVIITAWNPGFARPSADENRAADARLVADLARSGYEFWSAVGESPSGDFHEDGHIVWGMPESLGRELARAYGQFAIYHCDSRGHRVIVECVTATE